MVEIGHKTIKIRKKLDSVLMIQVRDAFLRKHPEYRRVHLSRDFLIEMCVKFYIGVHFDEDL